MKAFRMMSPSQRIGGEEAVQPLPRDDDHLARLRHPGRHEARMPVSMFSSPRKRPAPWWATTSSSLSAGDHHVDCPRHHDHEVVGRVAFPVEVLAGGHQPPRCPTCP